jgi:hypothetical protein
MIGKDTYYKDTYYMSGDGYLMPTRKGRSPPDTRCFNQATPFE